MSPALWIAIIFLLVVFISKAPIVYGLMGTLVIFMLVTGGDIGIVVSRMFNQVYSNYTFMAVPMFVLAANIMNETGTTEKLFNWCCALVGKRKGALAQVNIGCSLIFAGMTGSAIADASGIGQIEIKAMTDQGYDLPFSCATSAATALLGPTFPPSIPMVVYAMLSGASVGALFMGGILPALIMTAGFAIYVAIIAHKRNYPMGHKYTLKEFLKYTKESIWVLLTPVILLGGIYTGWLTPTEAGAVSGFYALLIGVFVYKTLNLKNFIGTLKSAAVQTGKVTLMSASSACISYIVATEGISAKLTNLIMGLTDNPTLVFFSVICLFLLMGCIVDIGPMQYVLLPLVIPILQSYGVNMIHFGVCVVLAMMIGLCTPPFGQLLFITCSLTGCKFKDLCKEIIPYIAIVIGILFLMIFIPDIVLLIPNLL